MVTQVLEKDTKKQNADPCDCMLRQFAVNNSYPSLFQLKNVCVYCKEMDICCDRPNFVEGSGVDSSHMTWTSVSL